MRWTPDVMIAYKRVGAPAISPDGRLVAYTISTPILDGEKSEYLSQIWVATADGEHNEQLTFAEKSSMEPSFSPDGTMLAFLSARGSDGKNQIWIIRLPAGEAKQLTKAKNGVNAFRWAPDSRRIAYTMVDPLSEKDEKERRERRDMILVDAHPNSAHLHVVNFDGVSEGDHRTRRLTSGRFHVNAFAWSPDGTSIVFDHQSTPSPDDWITSAISTVQVDGGAVSGLVDRKSADANPRYSPDGKWIAFVSGGDHPRWAGVRDLYVVRSAGGQPRALARTPDRRAALCSWPSTGTHLLCMEVDRTSSRLFSLPVDGSAPRILTPGVGNFTNATVSDDGSTIAYLHEASESTVEVFVTALGKLDPRKISDGNRDFPKLPMGRTEVIQWKSRDGTPVEGLLTYPVQHTAGARHPLILLIHGGPAAGFQQTYTAAGDPYPIQAFAQEGYAVLRPNPRGSTGYGIEFRFANINDWGFGDYDDVMAGVDTVIAMGVADPDSLVVAGWSYGGYLTAFIITRTNRFRAASVGAGITNLMSFNGTSEIPGYLPDYFGGEFWEKPEAYAKHSVIFRVGRVTTPTQVLHGELDVRVPVSQGRELYTALKRRGIPTEMVVYPRTPHAPQEPKFITDIGMRMISWFNNHLGRARPFPR